MNLKDHKLVKQHKDSFEIMSKDGKSFKVPKNNLKHHQIAIIMKMPKFDEGGTVPQEGDPNFRGPPQDWQELDPEVIPPSTTNGGNTGPFGGMRQQTNPSKDQMTGMIELPGEVAKFSTRNRPQEAGDTSAEASRAQDQTSGSPLQSAQNPETSIYDNGGNFNQKASASPYDYQQGNGPMAPDYKPESTDLYQDYLNTMQKASQTQKDAIQSQADLQATVANKQATIQDEAVRQMGIQQQIYQENLNAVSQEGSRLSQGIANTKIDPEHYWNSRSTLGKVGTLIGMMISGAGANAGQGNAAIQAYQRAVDEDIDAQKSNLGSQKNLLQYNLEKYRNLATAEAQTRLDLMSVTKGQIDAEAMRVGGPMAQQQAEILKSQLDQAMAPITMGIAKSRTAMKLINTPISSNTGANGSGVTQTYPLNVKGINDKIMGLQMLGRMPDVDSKAASSELGELVDQQKTLQTMNNEFDSLRGNTTKSERYMPNWTPTWNEQSKRYEASSGAFDAAVAKLLGTRASPAIMDRVQQLKPIEGDEPDTLKYKKDQLDNIIKTNMEKKQYPLLMKYNLVDPNDPLFRITDTSKPIGWNPSVPKR